MKTLDSLFKLSADMNPEKLALIDEDGIGLDYKQLEFRSYHLSVQIIALTQNLNKDNSMVAIMCERNIGMIVGILAILRARCAYVPVDPRSGCSF